MEQFELAFNKTSIYETLFFNIKSVSEFKSITEFKEQKPELFKQFELIAKVKYKYNTSGYEDGDNEVLNDLYKEKAVFYPEFSKIVAISYATLESNEGKIKRNLKKIVDKDEFNVIESFRQVLLQISSDGMKSTPHYFPTLCGHNIITNDIPLFIKRLFYYREKFDNKENLLPYILKKHLQSKPWDANTVDTLNLWKFNGVSNTPLTTVSDFIGLKRNTDILQMDEVSKYYWDNIEENQDEVLEKISLQSANETNLVIQLLNEFRQI